MHPCVDIASISAGNIVAKLHIWISVCSSGKISDDLGSRPVSFPS